MTARRTRIAVVGGLLAVALIAGCGDDDDERISASAPDFTVELPDGWEEQDADTREQAGEVGIDAVGDELGISEDSEFSIDVQALWSVTDPSEEFRTNINVFSEDLPGEVTLERYAEFSEQQLRAGSLATTVEPAADGPTVGGEPSKQIEYTVSQQVDVRLRVVSVLHDGAAYNVTLTALRDEFGEASAELDQILASWSWN